MSDLAGDGPNGFPAACAKLLCTPAAFEGDVDISSGTISGCHAYGTLTISQTVRVGRDPGGTFGFAACAETIIIGALLNANGGGEDPEVGPGAGGVCGTGGSHGGVGADLGMCGGGGVYGDMLLPRKLGSGGGGGSAGGKGGGAIELAANMINVIGFISANGEDGTLAVNPGSGGGSGGSILLQANSVLGAGRLDAQGGRGVGIAGGGGGGGRVAVYSGAAAANLTIDVGGGSSMNDGSKSGGTGSVHKVP